MLLNNISKGLQPPPEVLLTPNLTNYFQINELVTWMTLPQQLPLPNQSNEEDLPEFRMKDNLFTM